MEKIVEWIMRAVVVLICITVHELCHGYAAYKLGDDTAKRAGRLTLNPLKHIDPIGTLMLFVARFGWAKPVPVNPYNFSNMKRDMALTAAAGPASNFALAVLSACALKSVWATSYVAPYFPIEKWILHNPVAGFFVLMIWINTALGLFNLLPFPPLDGSKIISGFMTDDMYFRWMEFERKAAYLLMAILLISFVTKISLFSTLIGVPLDFIVDYLIDYAMPTRTGAFGL
ncbi:MAG: site-2 protease family protein [Candidatus Cloacimonetes bacterium]|nr:site-2 protease family protein [Candidatus Cloacimonadota bacterium]